MGIETEWMGERMNHKVLWRAVLCGAVLCGAVRCGAVWRQDNLHFRCAGRFLRCDDVCPTVF